MLRFSLNITQFISAQGNSPIHIAAIVIYDCNINIKLKNKYRQHISVKNTCFFFSDGKYDYFQEQMYRPLVAAEIISKD